MSGPANTQFALGVHVLTLLAGSAELAQTSNVLAASAGASPVHVRRVLGRLREADLVRSRPGAQGGWQLVPAPDDITLADVWEVLHGDGAVLAVHEASPDCAVGQRIQRSLLGIERRAARALQDELSGTTLAELAAGTRAGELARA